MNVTSIIKIILPIIIIVGFIALAVMQVQADKELKLETQVELKSKKAELIQLNNKYDKVLDKKVETQKQRDEQAEQIRQLEKDKQELEKQVRAKKRREAAKREKIAEANRQATMTRQASAEAEVQPEPTRSVSGNKESWLRASGIPESEWWAVDYIVSRESGWDPCAYNPGRSDCGANPVSACGLAQSLPCGKQSKYGHWTDPVANLKWQHEYVKNRYNGYAEAVAFWRANDWY